MMTRRVCAKRSDNEQIKALTSHVVAQRRELSALKATTIRNHDIQQQANKTMNRNIVHLMKGAAYRVSSRTRGGGGGGGGGTVDLAFRSAVYDAEQVVRTRNERTSAKLSSHPRCLHMLWNEYEFGIGVNKAAKLFTPEERGQVKHRYCLRKVFWDTVRQMVLSGWSAITACEKINDVYSDKSSISAKLFQMRSDRNAGGLPTVLLGTPL